MSGTRPKGAGADLIAGLTTAAVVVPKAMAYATIAGLPAEIGLHTALVPMVVYAMLGTSRVLSVSTTSTIAILMTSALAAAAPGGQPETLAAASTTLALLVGVFLGLAGVLRLGFVANFISDPVLTGFKAGIGLVIVVDQLPKLLGVHFTKGGFFQNVFSIAHHLPESSIPTVLLAVVTILLIVALEHTAPKVPAPLLAVIGGLAASAWLGFGARGIETVGAVSGGVPMPVLPDLSLARTMWPAALGIALMSFTETIAAGRTFVKPDEPRPSADRELFAIGAANLLGGFFRIMPAGGGTSQTAVNRRAGAVSQASSYVAAAVVVAILLFLAPVIAYLPQATLAAVVVATTIDLINPRDFAAIRAIRHIEFRWALVAFTGVVLLGSLQGIIVAIIVSLLALAHQVNHPPVYELARHRTTRAFQPRRDSFADHESFPGLLILRTEGLVYFANAERVGDKMWPLINAADPKVVVIDLSAVPDLEYTALRLLTQAERKLASSGVELWLAGLNPQVVQTMARAPLGKALGERRVFPTVEHAVAAFEASGGRPRS